jgi:phosphoribosyl 1,2-cyclic phosphodiesterase
VLTDNAEILLDAGSGLRLAGKAILQRNLRTNHTLLLSHTHWDHICGFPFFDPAYREHHSIRVVACHLPTAGALEEVFSEQMSPMTFPLPLRALSARVTFDQIPVGSTFMAEGGVVVRTAPLRHPGGATAYRLESGGRAVCYVTDTEHDLDCLDPTVLEFVRGADLMIYDSTYDDAEFPAKRGWGHSTWQQAIRVARAAGVRRVAFFHHDPEHDDAFLEAVEERAIAIFSGALVAREGMLLEV